MSSPFFRRAMVILSAGMLLQVGTCSVDTAAGMSELFTLILGRLIGGIVFGAFNVSTGGF